MNALRLACALGLLGLSPALAGGSGQNSVRYRCDGGQTLSVTYLPRLGVPNRARVSWRGQTHTLPPARSASGARYTDGRWTWWSKGLGGFLMVGEQTVAQGCQPR